MRSLAPPQSSSAASGRMFRDGKEDPVARKEKRGGGGEEYVFSAFRYHASFHSFSGKAHSARSADNHSPRRSFRKPFLLANNKTGPSKGNSSLSFIFTRVIRASLANTVFSGVFRIVLPSCVPCLSRTGGTPFPERSGAQRRSVSGMAERRRPNVRAEGGGLPGGSDGGAAPVLPKAPVGPPSSPDHRTPVQNSLRRRALLRRLLAHGVLLPLVLHLAIGPLFGARFLSAPCGKGVQEGGGVC